MELRVLIYKLSETFYLIIYIRTFFFLIIIFTNFIVSSVAVIFKNICVTFIL